MWLFICGRDLVPGDKMSPRQQWRASESPDNRASDPCSMLDSTTRMLPPFFLSGDLSPGSRMASRAYLTGPAWQHSYTPMSVPEVQRPLHSSELVCRNQEGAEKQGMEETVWHRLKLSFRSKDVEIGTKRPAEWGNVSSYVIVCTVPCCSSCLHTSQA